MHVCRSQIFVVKIMTKFEFLLSTLTLDVSNMSILMEEWQWINRRLKLFRIRLDLRTFQKLGASWVYQVMIESLS